MKSIILFGLLLFSTICISAQSSIYDYTVETLEGEDFSFSRLKGKKVMIVNTASKCGFTPQYEGLEELFRKYGGDDFVIVGFPANNFLRQEPGTAEEIREFCTKNYGVSFPIMAKISVKGNDMAPIYQWLTQKSKNGVQDSKVKWNFQKYLINEKGELEKVLSPKTKPQSDEIISWIEN
ncbi:glutathione peroxidase [Plebeiibacterium marinum]|uniref:Glutathione peroxidase n=1 Tax=Plebeiibacterium marinum TaxID=2992111 RepID=A0AAE3SIM6_9BACT|nr:glutathione peroxidase [Plebeiobacterium marinum]MCW3804860.1 glutathione peroxidase [Plebeiobacterium marinum]